MKKTAGGRGEADELGSNGGWGTGEELGSMGGEELGAGPWG